MPTEMPTSTTAMEPTATEIPTTGTMKFLTFSGWIFVICGMIGVAGFFDEVSRNGRDAGAFLGLGMGGFISGLLLFAVSSALHKLFQIEAHLRPAISAEAAVLAAATAERTEVRWGLRP